MTTNFGLSDGLSAQSLRNSGARVQLLHRSPILRKQMLLQIYAHTVDMGQYVAIDDNGEVLQSVRDYVPSLDGISNDGSSDDILITIDLETMKVVGMNKDQILDWVKNPKPFHYGMEDNE